MREQWASDRTDDPRPPVFILVCKNTRIAKVVYEWLAEDKRPPADRAVKARGFRNHEGGGQHDSRGHEGGPRDRHRRRQERRGAVDAVDAGHGRQNRRGRATAQGRPIYPEGFEELAQKLDRPLHPPGRDVRCIVSVGMLTEGWDCNTVTHIVGLRPFMSQLLCEQVVGRGLRRASYDAGRERAVRLRRSRRCSASRSR